MAQALPCTVAVAYVDRSPGPARPLYLGRGVAALRGVGPAVHRDDADRHFPEHQYPRHQHDLELWWAVTDGNAGTDHDRRRAGHDDHGQQHRASGVDVGPWRLRYQALLPADRRRERRD